MIPLTSPNWKRVFFAIFSVVSVCSGFVSVPSTYTSRRSDSTRHRGWSSRQIHSSRSSAGVTNTVEADAVKLDNGEKIVGTIAFLLPSQGAEEFRSKFGEYSPVENPTYMEAARQIASKAFWFSNGKIDTTIHLASVGEEQSNLNVLEQADVVIALGLSLDGDIKFAKDLFDKRLTLPAAQRFRQCEFTLDCSQTLSASVGPFDESSPSFASNIPWTDDASGRRFLEQMNGLFDRWTSDDFTVALMLFFNRFSGSEIDWVKHITDATWEKGPVRNAKEFYAMATKCGDCVTKCLQDETCKKCLETLTELDTRDQAASYRAIVSYESELLKEFSFCILQKNDIFGCTASIPTMPKVTPTPAWRGQPLTFDAAQKLLVAHLDDSEAPTGGLKTDVSWKVAAGANVAYDQFPSQNQLFYHTVNGREMWYDPVFRVETLDGRNIWCKRHYRVRNGPEPGTFYLSVLDNGVTSNEFWTIVAAADDLSWIVFHYAGAAAAVGQHYLGGLLCTADGTLPPPASREEIWKAFQSAGIQPWELFVVDNDETSDGAIAAGPAPLDFYRKDVLAKKKGGIKKY